MENAIEIRNLRKVFGTKTAVNDLTLDVASGEIFAVLGVNGAGKTTTIRMLTCLSKPTAGDAKIFGHSILTDVAEVKKIGNISPQETSVAPGLTVRENLEFIAGIYGLRKSECEKKAVDIGESLGLTEVWDSKARTLSGGWQRKLSIAMALISDPKVLYLDEPTLGLDVLARRELWKIIRSLRGKVTILLTTHYMEEAEALSDRIAIMNKGSLVTVGTMEQLREQSGREKLEDIFIAMVEDAT